MAMPGQEYGRSIRRIDMRSDGNEPRPNAAAKLRIVETVGQRMIIGCGCGNYFFATPGVAICDNCGAEGDTGRLARGGDAALC